MKKYYQYFGLALIMVFSFYYTNQISTIVLNKNPLMQTIREEESNYHITSVNATINGNTIIPGINGLKVNARESFYQMQSANVFNEYFLVYDQEKPEISLEDNKDKLIEEGNRKQKKVSFILETENSVSKYFLDNEIQADMLTTIDTYSRDSHFELLNHDVANFKLLEKTLNLNKENKHICVVTNENYDLCLKNKNYLVSPKLILTSNNIITIKKGIQNGSIIYIGENATLEDVKLLLKEIKYKDLSIVYLSELISEENKN